MSQVLRMQPTHMQTGSHSNAQRESYRGGEREGERERERERPVRSGPGSSPHQAVGNAVLPSCPFKETLLSSKMAGSFPRAL